MYYSSATAGRTNHKANFVNTGLFTVTLDMEDYYRIKDAEADKEKR